MRLLFVLFVLLSVQVNAQLVADNTRGLDSYFEGWLAESTKSAKSGKARGKIQREVVSLFKTAVNGPEESAGEEERLARVVYPSGKYSLVSAGIRYKVVNSLPKAGKTLSGWAENNIDYRSIYDSIAYSDVVPERSIDPIPIDPKKYRVTGLYLTEKRMKDISEFLEKDQVAGGSEEDDYNGRGGAKRGPSSDLLSGYIRLIAPHWGKRWNYRSYPVIHTIIIDKRASVALLNYRTHNGGGFARFKKEGKRWVLAESRITIMQ